MITAIVRRAGPMGLLLFLVIHVVLNARLRAEHFDVRLLAAGPDGKTQEAYADETPPEGGLNPRPVLRVRPGDRITVQFILTNVYPHGTVSNAGVRYYLVKESRLGQKNLPAVGTAVVEGTLSFQLKPQTRIGVRQQIVVRQPGVYLLRVETERTQREHEHFAALDVEIE